MTKFSCLPQKGFADLGKEGGGVMWDPAAKKAIARFDSKGEFETKDKAVIARLKELGFRVVGGETPEKADDGKKANAEG